MHRKKLGFDADGVIIDFFGSFIAYLGENLGVVLSLEDCLDPNIPHSLGVGLDEYRAIHQKFVDSNQYWALPPVPIFNLWHTMSK